MLKLDHLTVVAPSLADGVAHVRNCLDLDVPFGQRHSYMGTYNHLLQLGDTVYLEIVALDPVASAPSRQRWFGLNDILWINAGLKRVRIDGQQLFISSYVREICVPIGAIIDVRQNCWAEFSSHYDHLQRCDRIRR